jgi:4-hydroxybenzoate polyprenyltransferase
MGLALARVRDGFWPADALFGALFMLGAIAMRGAGCTWNDILDRDIDAKVARTRNRPLPSGAISVRLALVWLVAQSGVGLFVLLMLPQPAQIIALASLPLVALYPLMKRITWWPQAWLGLVFSWGALVAGAAIQTPDAWRGGIERLVISWDILLLYAGCVCWVIAYDTIYALQDKEDDALVGVRSTALLFKERWRAGVTGFYAAALFLWSCAMVQAGAGVVFVLPFAGLGLFVSTLVIDRIKDGSPETALAAFKLNFWLGLLAVCVIAAPGVIVTFPALFP